MLDEISLHNVPEHTEFPFLLKGKVKSTLGCPGGGKAEIQPGPQATEKRKSLKSQRKDESSRHTARGGGVPGKEFPGPGSLLLKQHSPTAAGRAVTGDTRPAVWRHSG